MFSQFSHTKERQVQDKLQTWTRAPAQTTPRPSPPPAPVSDTAKSSETKDAANNDEQNLPANLKLIKQMIEMLTGRAIHLFSMDQIQSDTVSVSAPSDNATQAANTPPPEVGWGVEYQHTEHVHEQQTMSFSAEGVIKTEDGREIQFKTTLDLSWEYTEDSSTLIQLGDAARPKKDPLVLNYAAPSAQLSNTLFNFDLDADGTTEKISKVGAGSGLLALDKNGNNSIDNGSELFGTRSGNGFKDLAAYDQDNNNWIDENDAVYGQLRLWIQDSEKGQLLTLKQANIGAIFLGNVDSPYQITPGQTNGGGEIKSTGVFLHESGEVGTAQQIDLYV